jgi:hypothetical protein
VATNSLKAAIPAPIRDGVAIALDALHIRKRYVSEPQGFDPKTGLPVDVAVYFPDFMPKAYQLTQWLAVMENHGSRI